MSRIIFGVAMLFAVPASCFAQNQRATESVRRPIGELSVAALRAITAELRQFRDDEKATSDAKRLAEIRSRIAALQAKLDSEVMKAPSTPYLDPFDLSLGQVGHIDAEFFKVVAVVNREQAIVAPVKTVTELGAAGIQVTQSFRRKSGPNLLLVGRTTEGLVDGRSIQLDSPVEIAGTSRIGAITIFVARVVGSPMPSRSQDEAPTMDPKTGPGNKVAFPRFIFGGQRWQVSVSRTA